MHPARLKTGQCRVLVNLIYKHVALQDTVYIIHYTLNCIMSDVTSSIKKTPVDLNIMDFKQMFDNEELPSLLSAFYDFSVKNDMLGLLYQANQNVTFAVKPPME